MLKWEHNDKCNHQAYKDCSRCFSLHLKAQRLKDCCIRTKKNWNWTFFYHFWIIQKFLLIWNKSIQIETFETLRLQLVHCNKGIYPNINTLLYTKTVLHHPNIKLNYSIRLVLIIPNILFLQTNQSQTQLLANFQAKVLKDGMRYKPDMTENSE